jgi:hypothetical protein
VEIDIEVVLDILVKVEEAEVNDIVLAVSVIDVVELDIEVVLDDV